MVITKFFKPENPYAPPSDWRLAPSHKSSNINAKIDIIIPVYKGIDQTKKCILSVLNSDFDRGNVRIIVYNDCSPETEINAFLNKLALDNKIILHKNNINRGFVVTANLAMSLSKENDVILLNSDTEVCGNWISKLNWHAYSRPKVGTVTPFSNNATICSYPNLHGFKEFPPGSNLEDFDSAFSEANKYKNILIPTAVGFCFYIRRDCLNEIGLFDESSFGMGYGEENDFSLRASKNGWVNLLAGDTFVYHEGAVSFSIDSDKKKELALKTLIQLHPDYESIIGEHIRRNEAYSLIFSAMMERKRQDKRPKILHILHNYGGGTEKHVKDLTNKYKTNAIHYVMIPDLNDGKNKNYHIFSTIDFEKINLAINKDSLSSVIEILQFIGINLVHIHHTMNYKIEEIKNIIDGLKVPYYLTIHDYFYICPQITLVNKKTGVYCGEPGIEGCNSCIAENKPFGAWNIEAWRETYSDLIRQANKIICPSIDVSNRFQKYYPREKIFNVPHEEIIAYSNKVEAPELKSNEKFRVAFIGILAPHKGKELIGSLLKKICDLNTEHDFEFKLIGYIPEIDNTDFFKESPIFSSTGPYEDTELLVELKKYHPHLIFFTSRCPETYSYTLSTALESGYPILAPNLGAFPERLNNRGWAWLYSIENSLEDILSLIISIKNQIKNQSPPRVNIFNSNKKKLEKEFYSNLYLEL
jgi:GT2 family glycosyltransferase